MPAPVVVALIPLCRCPICRTFAIVELTPQQRAAQPDATTLVCHPGLGGCNHGFTDARQHPTSPPCRCDTCIGLG